MKNLKTLLILVVLTALSQSASALQTKDILGVWNLKEFYTESEDGTRTPWCTDAYGTIAYLPGQTMTVGINCKGVRNGSSAERMSGTLFYSGFFEVDTQAGTVIHRVRNYSDSSLNRTYTRQVQMSDPNHLRLEGILAKGKKAIVTWERAEKFNYSDHPLHGVWELVGSENEVSGSKTPVPFCNGFHGTILYTPGGYAAVSINCGKKAGASEPADQFNRKYFYNGRYEKKGQVLIQTPDNASVVSHIASPNRRAMTLKDDILTLEGVNGSRFKAIWKKRTSFTDIEPSGSAR